MEVSDSGMPILRISITGCVMKKNVTTAFSSDNGTRDTLVKLLHLQMPTSQAQRRRIHVSIDDSTFAINSQESIIHTKPNVPCPFLQKKLKRCKVLCVSRHT